MSLAQKFFVALTMAFLVVAVLLFITNTALVAGAICLFVSILGYIILAGMLLNDQRQDEVESVNLG